MRNTIDFKICFRGTALTALTAAATAATAAGCLHEAGEPDARAGLAPATTEIIVTNGSSINGPLLNGKGAPGSEVYGKDVVGVSAFGASLRGLTLQGSELATVRASDGAVVSGAALVGATFNTHMPDDARIALRIDAHAATASEHHAGSTVHHYALSYRATGATVWTPVCSQRAGAPVLAIPLVGRWSYAEGVPGGGAKLDAPDWITFACDGFALYKCVRLGYEPWTASAEVQLGGHHQACTRAQRADYCGDGRSYTVASQLINIFDNVGIQDDTASWSLEAEWAASGARCVSRPRVPGMAPDCALSKCGASPSWGTTLIVTEAP
ncbi:MAG TPA: ADYC domain-containing protein [Kofleriaceae bacterium]|nr:ADYC domain-containing protein [Kofleriaceae bacterium]